MNRCFDAYAVVDFSARSSPSPVKPSADAIWLGTAAARGPVHVSYHRTRAAGMTRLDDWVTRQLRRRRRVFVGFDFALGYPSGFARSIALPVTRMNAPWRALWRYLAEVISDDARNGNNRFDVARELNARSEPSEEPGPFWGVPAAKATPGLSERRGFAWPYGRARLARLRETERRCQGVQEVWKLAGVGSVGSQSLLGIAAVARWLDQAQWRDRGVVWPFRHGFVAPSEARAPDVILAEVFPGRWRSMYAENLGQPGVIRDAVQVDAGCRWARRLDADGEFASCFAEPRGLTPAQRKCSINEEGWILGV